MIIGNVIVHLIDTQERNVNTLDKLKQNNKTKTNNMAQTVTTQMNEFRRLEDGRIVLDGLVWSQYAEKAIEIKDEDNGFKVFNIKLDGVSYYPVGYDKRKKK